MTGTVTSVNAARKWFYAEGADTGGARCFKLEKMPFSHIEALQEFVTRTRGVGSKAMLTKRRRPKGRRAQPASAAPLTAAQAAPPAAAQASPDAAAAPPAAADTAGAPQVTAPQVGIPVAPECAAMAVHHKSAFLKAQLELPAQFTVAQVTAEAERQLGLTPPPGEKIGNRLERAFQELR